MTSQSTFRRLLLVAIVALAAMVAVEATQVMHRPDNYKDAAGTFKVESISKTNAVQKRAANKVSFAYFTNWGIYDANFQPTDIVATTVTHVLYSFADVSPINGAIGLTDVFADEQKRFPGDSESETGNNLYGNLKQLYLLKKKHRNLKVLLSIGGWTYSQAGHFDFVTSASSRTKFVSTAVQLVEDYGFDGIDIDFEYPANTAQGQGFADLVTSLRTAFDQLASRKGDTIPYQITAAVAASSENSTFLNVPQLNAGLDYWNLMAYDYSGSWVKYTDHQANLYLGVRTGVNTDSAIQSYISRGATAAKITLGMPLYGRAFADTHGLWHPFNGVGLGTFEPGIYPYKTLPLTGARVYENTTDVTSYSYDVAKREFVSYDTPNIVKIKTQYINNKGLAGSMFWELSTDKVGAESLVGVSAALLGTLDQTRNHLSYPNSKWDNVRSNMGGGGTGTSTTTTAPASTPTSGTGCAGVPAWSVSATFVGGQKASYGGRLWTAKWWTQGDTPGGSAGVWTDNGAC